jgi:hypothetical protein
MVEDGSPTSVPLRSLLIELITLAKIPQFTPRFIFMIPSARLIPFG